MLIDFVSDLSCMMLKDGEMINPFRPWLAWQQGWV
jgi:hypothetical protein